MGQLDAWILRLVFLERDGTFVLFAPVGRSRVVLVSIIKLRKIRAFVHLPRVCLRGTNTGRGKGVTFVCHFTALIFRQAGYIFFVVFQVFESVLSSSYLYTCLKEGKKMYFCSKKVVSFIKNEMK